MHLYTILKLKLKEICKNTCTETSFQQGLHGNLLQVYMTGYFHEVILFPLYQKSQIKNVQKVK
jgi:hypothetical protein